MTTSTPDNLDERLGALTTWSGDSPELWKRALAQPKRTSFLELLAAFTPRLVRTRPVTATIGLGAVTLVIVSFIQSAGSRSDSEYAWYGSAVPKNPANQATSAIVQDRQWSVVRDDFGSFNTGERVTGTVTDINGDGSAPFFEDAPGFDIEAAVNQGNTSGAGGAHRITNSSLAFGVTEYNTANSGAAFGVPDVAHQQDSISADRAVIRKSTIELSSPDVRAAYFKAAQSLSEARGEFVQSSSLTGEGNAAQAQITLRVAADRLSAVLNELRALGKVHTDQTTGEDVTNQAVDLEARLRNEQRVEKELLELLDKRHDAPLKEVLDVRDRLAMVRNSIESITAQRDRLGKLVSLATVLVIIRGDELPAPVVTEESFVDYLGASLMTSLKNGGRTLADTLAGAVALIIGGMLWWLILITVVAAAAKVIRRRFALA